MNISYLFEDTSLREVDCLLTPPQIRNRGLRFVSPTGEVKKEAVKKLPKEASTYAVYQDRNNNSFLILYTTGLRLNPGSMQRLQEALI